MNKEISEAFNKVIQEFNFNKVIQEFNFNKVHQALHALVQE